MNRNNIITPLSIVVGFEMYLEIILRNVKKQTNSKENIIKLYKNLLFRYIVRMYEGMPNQVSEDPFIGSKS